MLDDQEFFWDWIKHEDNLSTNRNNFFLVGEAIFCGGIFAFSQTPPMIFYGAGILISLVWLYANMSQSFLTVRHIVRKLEEIEPRWRDINKKRKIWGDVDLFVGIILPVGFLLLWIFSALN